MQNEIEKDPEIKVTYYSLRDKEEIQKYQKNTYKWIEKNKDKWKEYQKEYQKNYLKKEENNISHTSRLLLREYFNRCIKKNFILKRYFKKNAKILPYDFFDFVRWFAEIKLKYKKIEQLTIDHIIPVKIFEDFNVKNTHIFNDFLNIQFLSTKENSKKSFLITFKGMKLSKVLEEKFPEELKGFTLYVSKLYLLKNLYSLELIKKTTGYDLTEYRKEVVKKVKEATKELKEYKKKLYHLRYMKKRGSKSIKVELDNNIGEN